MMTLQSISKSVAGRLQIVEQMITKNQARLSEAIKNEHEWDEILDLKQKIESMIEEKVLLTDLRNYYEGFLD